MVFSASRGVPSTVSSLSTEPLARDHTKTSRLPCSNCMGGAGPFQAEASASRWYVNPFAPVLLYANELPLHVISPVFAHWDPDGTEMVDHVNALAKNRSHIFFSLSERKK